MFPSSRHGLLLASGDPTALSRTGQTPFSVILVLQEAGGPRQEWTVLGELIPAFSSRNLCCDAAGLDFFRMISFPLYSIE